MAFPTSGLVSYWKLDESSGNATDSKGSNTLTNNGSASYTTGKINNGIDLERSSTQYLSIADASQSGLDPTEDFSVSCWIKPESEPDPDTGAIVFAKFRTSTGGHFFFTYYRNGSGSTDYYTQAEFRDSSFNYSRALIDSRTRFFENGTWYHLVVTFKPADGWQGIKIYINASLKTTVNDGNSATSYGANDGPFTLGYGTGWNYHDGMIDEVGFWNRALSSTEVSDLYNSGSGLTYTAGGGTTAIHSTLLTLNAG